MTGDYWVGVASVSALTSIPAPRVGTLPRVAGLPPREIYRVEAVAKSDDPDMPGWAYFLDLWTETGPARLHIEGELEESGERYTVTLNDILP